MSSPIPKSAPNHSAPAAATGGELGGATDGGGGPVDEQDLTARKYGEVLMNGLSSVGVVVGYSKGEDGYVFLVGNCIVKKVNNF